MVMFYNVCVYVCAIVSPVDTEGVTGLVSRIGTEAAACRSAASGQWTPQPIYSSLTTEGKTKQLPIIYLSMEILSFHNKTVLLYLNELALCLNEFN